MKKTSISASSKVPANAMWGGHYRQGPSEIMAQINASVDIDHRLYRQDIKASIAHAEMLTACGIIIPRDGKAIVKGLRQIENEIESGVFQFSAALEDVHMNIEARLKGLIGDAAGRLHTARSRNDQVATDFRLWLRDELHALDSRIADLQAALIDQAERHAATLMPGYTHLQPAQPVTFGHHLLAYVEMLGRDRDRLRDCARRVNEMPLGAAALAGTGFPIDRHMTARRLGFTRPLANSMDAVSARDFALEFLGAAAILGTHLSRFAEEITIWVTPAFGFIKLSEAFTTGSSIMPQKRNPDAAELVRGKTGRLLGNFITLATVLKGLALTYAKDLQEDKEAVFDTADTLGLMLEASAGIARDMQPDAAAMQRALRQGYITATDLADWLVRAAAIPFREAHHITGRIVRLAESRGCQLSDLPLGAMQAIDPRIGAEIFAALDPARAVHSRISLGGTAPRLVKQAALRARKKFC